MFCVNALAGFGMRRQFVPCNWVSESLFHFIDIWPNNWAASPRSQRARTFQNFSKIDNSGLAASTLRAKSHADARKLYEHGYCKVV